MITSYIISHDYIVSSIVSFPYSYIGCTKNSKVAACHRVDVGILVPGLDHLGTLAELHDLDQNHIPRKEERGQVEKDPTVDRQCLDEEGMLGAEKIQRRELALVFLVSACIPQSGNLTRNLASLALCKKYRLCWMER